MAYISVVIPVFKAEDCLKELYNRLKKALENITEDFEIIFVEDCGGDRSWDLINVLGSMDSRVKGIQFSRNFGQHYGITAGLDYCDGDWVVIMDCDLQDPPEEIPRLYAKAQEGFEVVLARRCQRKDPFIKRLNSKIFYSVFNYFTEMKYDGRVGNFRIISRKVVASFKLMREQLRLLGGLIEWMGFPTAYIDIQHHERFSGKSTYTLKKLFKLAFDSIISYSYKPLRLSIGLGFLISLMSFLSGLIIIFRKLFYGTSVMGWSSLMVSIYFIGGVIIFILGIIGLYIGKSFDEVKRRPLYIIDERVNLGYNTREM